VPTSPELVSQERSSSSSSSSYKITIRYLIQLQKLLAPGNWMFGGMSALLGLALTSFDELKQAPLKLMEAERSKSNDNMTLSTRDPLRDWTPF